MIEVIKAAKKLVDILRHWSDNPDVMALIEALIALLVAVKPFLGNRQQLFAANDMAEEDAMEMIEIALTDEVVSTTEQPTELSLIVLEAILTVIKVALRLWLGL